MTDCVELGKEAKNIRGSTSTRTRSVFDSRERFTFSGSYELDKEAKNTEGSTSTGPPVIWFGDLAFMFGGSPLRNLERPSLSPCCDLDYVLIGVRKYVILQDGTGDEDMHEDKPPLEECTDDEDKGEVRLNKIFC